MNHDIEVSGRMATCVSRPSRWLRRAVICLMVTAVLASVATIFSCRARATQGVSARRSSAPDPMALALAAKTLLDHDRDPEALAVLESGLQSFPRERHLLLLHALVTLRQGMPEVTLRDLDALGGDTAGDEGFLTFLRGTALLNAEREEEALSTFDTGLRAAPEDAHLLLGRGTALRRLGKLEDAVVTLEQGLAVVESGDPASQSLRIQRALAEAMREGRLTADPEDVPSEASPGEPTGAARELESRGLLRHQ